jgi:hypothetical protein
MIYFCCDEYRRNLLKNQGIYNGIDFLEVADNLSDPYEQRQRRLFVHFINDLAPGVLEKDNVIIEGGERIRNIKIVGVVSGAVGSPPSSPPTGFPPNVLVVEVESPGDFSFYTLRLVKDAKHKEPPEGFDPILSTVDFSFKVACPSEFDCKSQRVCPGEAVKQPEINYLAKDYASFRRLMLDRLAVIMPDWKERSPADLGITLVELLAYVGDYLSYRQDAITTEAYLGTARQRVSVRRHARLVDYFMHEGCSARAWVHIRVRPDVNNLELKRDSGTNITRVLTRIEDIVGQAPLISLNSPTYKQIIWEKTEVFELMHDVRLFAAHNEMRFYTWGHRECCLPKGATRAFLRGSYPNLKKGDVLILAEVRDPQTGKTEDADPTCRHAVCLTEVTPGNDPLGNQSPASPPLSSPPGPFGIPVTEIKWNPVDALPFPLCISTRINNHYYDDVSAALGNIVLADHGLTVRDEELEKVPQSNPALTKVTPWEGDRCEKRQEVLTPHRYHPKLKYTPLTHAAPYNVDNPPDSARAAMHWSMRSPLPEITLSATGTGENSEMWQAKRDLLNSGPDKKEFVVEMETDGTAYLRFGDDRFGVRPAPDTQFHATYRIGNGRRGNVGADALVHIVTDDPAFITELDNPVIVEVQNPLPASGGVEPESLEKVRQDAPAAFRTQERAVTPEDYALMAQGCRPDVQRAAATFRWTGSWRTAFVTIDRLGGLEVDDEFEKDILQCLEKYRMAGQDVEVDGPRYVPLEIEMIVCVEPDYFRSDVKAALLKVFSDRILPDGRLGIFHPDNFTFRQSIYLSPLYAAAQNTAGVSSVQITTFRRQGSSGKEALDAGKLELGRLEIARLDNDPNFPERGVFNLIIRGGR